MTYTSTMSLQKRLWGICQMAAQEVQESDPDHVISWRVGTAQELAVVAAPEHCPAAIIEVASDRIYLIWYDSGKLEVRVALDENNLVAGAITNMTILAATNPEGDFQVAEALEAIL